MRIQRQLQFSGDLLQVYTIIDTNADPSTCIAKIMSGSEINSLHTFHSVGICYEGCLCSAALDYGLACSPTACSRRIEACSLENLALQQRLGMLKRKHPRPRMGAVDKIFWVFARRLWGAWKQSPVLVSPETVARWHRAGFRLTGV